MPHTTPDPGDNDVEDVEAVRAENAWLRIQLDAHRTALQGIAALIAVAQRTTGTPRAAPPAARR